MSDYSVGGYKSKLPDFSKELTKLINTKEAIKNICIEYKGNIDNKTPFSKYPEVIRTLIKLGGVEPEGTLVVTSNGIYSVAGLKSVEVNVPASFEASEMDGIVDNTLTTFVMPTGRTKIVPRCFYQRSALKVVNLGEVQSIGEYAFYQTGITSLALPSTITTIGQYAFQGCTLLQSLTINSNILNSYVFSGCTALKTVTIGDITLTSLPSRLFEGCTGLKDFPFKKFKTINSYCFYQAGKNNTKEEAIELLCAEPIDIRDYAFQEANIKSINVNYGNNYLYCYTYCNATNTESVDVRNWKTSTSSSYGNYAFYNNQAKTFKMNDVASYYKNYMFANCYYAESIEGVTPIGTIYDYCFQNFGSKRTNGERLTIDLSKGTFTQINSYAFSNLVDTDVILPSTVTSIQANAFNGCSGLHLFLNSSPTLGNANAFDNNKNLIVFTEFNNIESLASKTNWTAVKDNVYGYALGSSFNGAFPQYSGTTDVLWYTDLTLSTIATTIDPDTTYYCILGPVYLSKVTGLNCTVDVTDEDGNSYSVDDRIILGKKLTITFNPDGDNTIPYQVKLNGIVYDLNNFNNQITNVIVESNIQVIAIYWDGITMPYNPTFADNEWDMIKLGIESRVGFDIGWKIGDTKTITTTEGYTFTIRICDTMEGRYTKTDGTPTNAVLEFVEGYPKTSALNNTTKEGYWAGGGWATCDMNTASSNLGTLGNSYGVLSLQAFLKTLPEELQNIVAEISLTGYSCTSPNPRTGTSKLFLPNEYEVWGLRHYSSSIEETDQFELYKEKGAEALKKKRLNSSNYEWFWLRSPFSGSYYSFSVWQGSAYHGYSSSSSYGVAPVFAI